jgi:hypothetical protein
MINEGLIGQQADTFAKATEAVPRRTNRVLQIDSLVGGFVVTRHSDYSRPEREVVPNTDCLVSLVAKWAEEGDEPR